MDDETCWLLLYSNVPEHNLTHAKDVDFLVDTYFQWDERQPQEEHNFREWLNNPPLGHITPLPNGQGNIVRCRKAKNT